MRDLIAGRYLSGLYNSKNGIKIELVWDAENNFFLLKIIKIKKAIKELKAVKKLK